METMKKRPELEMTKRTAQDEPAEDKSPHGVIMRAAALLRLLGERAEGASLSQLAHRSGLARSTVQRIVAALEDEGLVMIAGPAGGFVLGPEFRRLAAQTRGETSEIIRPIIRGLSDRLEETVDYSMVRDRAIVFLDQAIGRQPLLAVSGIGASFPLHCTSTGKAYLAQLSDDQVLALIGSSYERMTSRTLTSFEDLKEDLDAIRHSGFAFDEEEHHEGICAVGMVFQDGARNWIGISVPTPRTRFSEKKPAIVRGLREARRLAEDQFGA